MPDCDGGPLVAQVHELQRQPAHKTAMDLDRVEEREPKTPEFAFGSQVGDAVRRREHNFAGDHVPMLEVVERPVFPDGQYVSIAVESPCIRWINHLVLGDKPLQYRSAEDCHVSRVIPLCQRLMNFRQEPAVAPAACPSAWRTRCMLPPVRTPPQRSRKGRS